MLHYSLLAGSLSSYLSIAPMLMTTASLALFAAKDLEHLIDAAFVVLGETVACDFVSAFYRYSGQGLLKERDSRGREYSPEFLRRYIELTPAIPAARANPGVPVLTTRALLPRSAQDLKQSAFYREIMRTQGWRHGIALCVWSDPLAEMPMFVMSVYRKDDRKDFSSADLAALNEIHPFLSCAVNRLYELETVQTLHDGMVMTAHHGSQGMAVLEWDLRLIEANAVARRVCASWTEERPWTRTQRGRRAWRLPSAIATACAELRRDWDASARHDSNGATMRRRSLIVHPHLIGVTAAITVLTRQPAGLSTPRFVIEFIKTDRPEQVSLRLDKLTPAERAIATALVEGLSNQEIADQVAKTVPAVKFLLHRMYVKTGVPNRAALAAVLRSRRS